MPHHYAVRTRSGRLAIRSHTEARVLWRAILAKVPDPLALCLMPDHVHLLHARDVSPALGLALRGYARWRNRRLRIGGPLWERLGAPEPVKDGLKLRRSERYIHLNPCRARLVSDPLSWPWSTHRDRVGLAMPAARQRVPDPDAYHHYVSADPSVAVEGTLLPCGTDRADSDQVYAAVSAVTRSPWERLQLRGSPRTLWIRSLRLFTDLTLPAIAHEARVSLSTVQRVAPTWSGPALVVGRVLGDLRFNALEPGELTHKARWHRYRGRG